MLLYHGGEGDGVLYHGEEGDGVEDFLPDPLWSLCQHLWFRQHHPPLPQSPAPRILSILSTPANAVFLSPPPPPGQKKG